MTERKGNIPHILTLLTLWNNHNLLAFHFCCKTKFYGLSHMNAFFILTEKMEHLLLYLACSYETQTERKSLSLRTERTSTIKQSISDRNTELRDVYIRNQHQILTIVDILEWWKSKKQIFVHDHLVSSTRYGWKILFSKCNIKRLHGKFYFAANSNSRTYSNKLESIKLFHKFRFSKFYAIEISEETKRINIPISRDLS